jgi:hypothetical protein
MDKQRIESKRKSKMTQFNKNLNKDQSQTKIHKNSSLDSLDSDKQSIQRAKIIERLKKKKMSIFSNSALS